MSKNTNKEATFCKLVNQISHEIYDDVMDDCHVVLIHDCVYECDMTFDEVIALYTEAKEKYFSDDYDKVEDFAVYLYFCKVNNLDRPEKDYQFIKEFTVRMDNGDEYIAMEAHYDFEKKKEDIISWFKDKHSSEVYWLDNEYRGVYVQKKHIVSIALTDSRYVV